MARGGRVVATIIRGKRKGEEVKLAQWCNDWFTTDTNDVISPLSLQLTPDEIGEVLASELRGQCGHMFMLYNLSDDGRFSKKART